MKGTIVCCLKDMVVEKFGADVWREALVSSGLEADAVILTQDDFPDEKVLEVIGNLCKKLGITLEQAADAFGEHWCVTYAPRVYHGFYMGVKSARDFLKRLDAVHDMTTKTMNNATPPRFFYEDRPDGTLVMEYRSKRNLMPIFIGLVKGVGKHFGEKLKISQTGANKIEIAFG